MQLFAELGEEFGPNPGLNLIPGVISEIKNNGLRLPHIGWNEVLKPNEGNSILFSGIPDKICFALYIVFLIPTSLKNILLERQTMELIYCSSSVTKCIWSAISS